MAVNKQKPLPFVVANHKNWLNATHRNRKQVHELVLVCCMRIWASSRTCFMKHHFKVDVIKANSTRCFQNPPEEDNSFDSLSNTLSLSSSHQQTSSSSFFSTFNCTFNAIKCTFTQRNAIRAHKNTTTIILPYLFILSSQTTNIPHIRSLGRILTHSPNQNERERERATCFKNTV